MDKITKFLLKLSLKERNFILEIMNKILSLDLNWLDIKKLQWEDNLFRIRKGKIRIVFKIEWKNWKIIDINYRDTIYK
jgi:mRNA-degrading endonuclease RelE of RelBE toxin-antitoxin system